MRYIDEFRNPAAAQQLANEMRQMPPADNGKQLCFMEICGTHTMSIARHGIREVLPPGVRLVSGPGCPVCVTPAGYIDQAIRLAGDGHIICSFGDMLNVPGSTTSLAAVRSKGADVRICYSPREALQTAQNNPSKEVIFLVIGFETTIAPVISMLEEAINSDTENISLLTAFKQVPPALHALLNDPELRLDGLLCPAHVSAIIGAEAYQPFTEKYHIPCVIAGFEPLDILLGIRGLLTQCAESEAKVDNQYSRVVKPAGNQAAQDLIKRFLEPCDTIWRGLGGLPRSGLQLKKEHSHHDAAVRFSLPEAVTTEPPGCRCGDVLRGIITPRQCPLFGNTCTPDSPVGACMVSSEGSCAAAYRYSGIK